MKKLTLSLIVMTGLMLMMIGSVSAFPLGYGIWQPDATSGTVEWTDAQANSGVYSAYLMVKHPDVYTSDSNEIYVLPIEGIAELNDLNSFSFYYFRPSTLGDASEIPPQVDLWLDTNHDGNDNEWLLGQIDLATTFDVWVEVPLEAIEWIRATGGKIYGTGSAGLTAAKVDLGTAWVQGFGVMVGSPATRDDLRIEEGKYYIDDIEINGIVYDFEQPTEVYVDDDEVCGGNEPCYTIIQEGIDAVAEGGTVNVYAGTYNENIVIDKSLTVESVSGAEVTIIDALGAEAGVSVDGVETIVFKGFTVENFHKVGVVIKNTDSVQIEDNIITATDHSAAPNGIQVGYVMDYTATTGTIKNNEVSGCHYNIYDPLTMTYEEEWTGSGVLVIAPNSGLTISDNEVQNSDVGLDIEAGSGTLVTNNDVHDNSYGLVSWNEDPSINYNNIVNNRDGIYRAVDGSGTGILNAEYNWWGAADGPSGVGPGTGDSVSTNVDYDPWCLNSECTNLGGEGADFIALSVPDFIDYETLYGFDGFKSKDIPIVLENVGSLDVTVTPYLVVENSDPVFEYINFNDDGNSGLIGVFSTIIDMAVTNLGEFPPIFSSEKSLTTWIELTESLGKLVGPQTGTIYFQAVEA